MIVGESLNSGNATFDDQSAMIYDFIATACQEFSRGDSVMTEETMNSVSIFVTRTVMVKGQRAATVASEKQRRGKTRWPGADNDAVVQMLFPPKRVLCNPQCKSTITQASLSTGPGLCNWKRGCERGLRG